MEAANILTIPVMAFVLTEAQIGWITLVPLAAVMVLLGIGAIYWRFKVRQLRGEPVDANRILRPIAAWQYPSLALTLAGCAAAAFGWLVPTATVGLADRVAATVCAVLAALEYVNYYHRQLQHFDNAADFKRMLRGKGFRQSWMARDLAAWREPAARG